MRCHHSLGEETIALSLLALALGPEEPAWRHFIAGTARSHRCHPPLITPASEPRARSRFWVCSSVVDNNGGGTSGDKLP